MDISLVIPIYNEAEGLPDLNRAVSETLDRLLQSTEIVFVDDGSKDGSASVLDELAASDPRVRVQPFARNYGRPAALMAGLPDSTWGGRSPVVGRRSGRRV